MGNSNPPNRNVQIGIQFNKLINLQKVTDNDSINTIKDERTDQNNISEEVSSY